MVTYLTGHFENTKVCDALIREWEADCTREENGAWIEKNKRGQEIKFRQSFTKQNQK